MKLGPGLSQSPVCPQLHKALAGHNVLKVYEGFTWLVLSPSTATLLVTSNLIPASSFGSPNNFLEAIIRANTYPTLTAEHHKKKLNGSLSNIIPITPTQRRYDFAHSSYIENECQQKVVACSRKWKSMSDVKN